MIILKQNDKEIGSVIIGEGMEIGIAKASNCVVSTYAISDGPEEWLGVYDSPEMANYVSREIFKALSKGEAYYKMPSAKEIDDIFMAKAADELEAEQLRLKLQGGGKNE